MKIKNKFKYLLMAVFALAVFLFTAYSGSGLAISYANSSTSVQAAFESTNVLDDLKNSTVDDKEFDLSEWNFDERKDTQIVSFIEFCYSFYSSRQNDYALYVYVYNPKGIDYDYTSGLNCISMTYTNDVDNSTEYLKYRLSYLNMSTASGYEGLFLKYKIILSDSQKISILATLNSSERVYKVSEIELLVKGETEAQFYPVNSTYVYSGYSVGYGTNSAIDDTLSCTVSGLTSISPNVYHTFYRSNGFNSTNTYTRDTLQSVYFSVPNSILDEYGEIAGVRATWLKTMLQWAFVTGEQYYYDLVKKYMGYDMSNGKAVGGAEKVDLSLLSNARIYAKDTSGDTKFYFDYGQYDAEAKANFGWFSGLYYSGSTIDSADSYIVPREDILATMREYHDEYDTKTAYIYDTTPSNPPAGWFFQKYSYSVPYASEYLTVDNIVYPYSKALFESWENSAVIADISKDKEYRLTSSVIDRNWWQKLWHSSGTVYTTIFDGIEAIKYVEDSDFKSTPKLTCDGLFIDESDYIDFKNFYDKSIKNDETVILLRFDIGEYSALETSLGTTNNSTLVSPNISISSTNGYIFKQNAYLGFDIIHLELEGEKGVTIIPVLMSPKTLVGNAEPPIETSPDLSWWDKFVKIVKSILIIIIVVIVFLILYPILAPVLGFVVKGLLNLIALPFKLIASLFKRRKE